MQIFAFNRLGNKCQTAFAATLCVYEGVNPQFFQQASCKHLPGCEAIRVACRWHCLTCVEGSILKRRMKQPRNIDLRLLAYFQKTAEIGNITRAASALNVAQPTLSKALNLLETQLGVSLFERHAHGVSLTAIGSRLLSHADLVIAQVSDARKEVEALRVGAAGHVRVGAGPSWVRRIFPKVAADLLKERPDLQITVESGFDGQLLDRLSAGDLDFVVAERPLEDARDRYLYDGLTSDALVVFARSSHPLAGQQNVSIETALSYSWALPPSHTLARRKLDGNLVSLGAPPPDPTVESSSLTFLLSVAYHVDILLYTARTLLGTPEGAGLVEIDIPDLVNIREAGLIFRKPKLLSGAAQAVVDRLTLECVEDAVN